MGSKKHRWPMWKRSLWHALKSLVRNNPGAALAAAGAGTSYAIKGAAEEVQNALATSQTTLGSRQKATVEDAREFVESLSPLERKALAELETEARKSDS
jgi:hypothetical protein